MSPSQPLPDKTRSTDAFSRWENEVRFELFSERDLPTLSVPEQIAAELARRIVRGALEPGRRIAEQEVANEFKVSRGPVREAIRVLEREGLVTVLPRRGAVVTELSAHEVAELFEIRAALFALVVQKIVQQPDTELLAALRAGVARLDALAEGEGDGDAYAETVYRLLVLVARHCDNLRLQRMLSALSLQTLRYSKLSLARVERRKRSARLWRSTLTAIERGDTERAVALARQRIRESSDEALRQLSLS